MNDATRDWGVQACLLMSTAIVCGFFTFAAYSFHVGISKQTVYTGIVGYWLGMYLLFSVAVSIVCLLLIVWMAATRRGSWKRCTFTFASAWLVTLLAYAAWHVLAQSRYLAAA